MVDLGKTYSELAQEYGSVEFKSILEKPDLWRELESDVERVKDSLSPDSYRLIKQAIALRIQQLTQGQP